MLWVIHKVHRKGGAWFTFLASHHPQRKHDILQHDLIGSLADQPAFRYLTFGCCRSLWILLLLLLILLLLMRREGLCVVYAALLIRPTINPASPPRLTPTLREEIMLFNHGLFFLCTGAWTVIFFLQIYAKSGLVEKLTDSRCNNNICNDDEGSCQLWWEEHLVLPTHCNSESSSTTPTLHNTHSIQYSIQYNTIQYQIQYPLCTIPTHPALKTQWRKAPQHGPGTHTAQTMHTAHCAALTSYMVLGQLGLRQVGQLTTLKNLNNHLYQFFRTVQE